MEAAAREVAEAAAAVHGGGSSGGGGDGQRPQLSRQARSTSSHAVVQKLVAARARHRDVGISSLPRSR